MAVTVATFAVTATVPIIFLVGSANGDLFLRIHAELEIAPDTGSLFTVAAVLLAIAVITKVLPLVVSIESPTLSSTPSRLFVAVSALLVA